MAVYFLNLKTFGRSGGSSAVSAAAYRAGERIRDERSGRTYDHTERQDVLHKEIMLPTQFANSEMNWARERASLWNLAESAEARSNARVAREYLVALPVELDPGQRLKLARDFSQELVERYQFAVDLAVHAPRDFPGSDPRNFHAHLLATTREVAPGGLAAKTTLELNDTKRRELGLGPAINELLHVRERWSIVTNEALREANLAVRVDHRTLAAQGIDREPYPYIPRAAYEMERHGYRSGQAERLRAGYLERIHARERERQAQRAPEAKHTHPVDSARQSVEEWSRYRREALAAGIEPRTAEEVARQSVENWLRYRAGTERTVPDGKERSADDQLFL